jgi:hypothetical protein
MFFTNISLNNNNTYIKEIAESVKFHTKTQKFNTLLTICIILIGLIGNFITVFIYGQKKYRKNSSNVFLLCLALNDSLFLVVHFFEDIIHNLKSYFDLEQEKIQFINKIDFISQNDLACKFANYLRYSLRMISAYLIIAFTIQRLIIVYKPLNEMNKRKSSAWKSVILVIFMSFFLNLWTFLLFKLNEISEGNFYCDIVDDLKLINYYINILYSVFVMIIPIIILLLLNILIIYKLTKANKKRKIITNSKLVTSINQINRVENPHSDIIRLEPILVNNNLLDCKKKRKPTDTKIVLILVSISYALLNLPYLITM